MRLGQAKSLATSPPSPPHSTAKSLVLWGEEGSPGPCSYLSSSLSSYLYSQNLIFIFSPTFYLLVLIFCCSKAMSFFSFSTLIFRSGLDMVYEREIKRCCCLYGSELDRLRQFFFLLVLLFCYSKVVPFFSILTLASDLV